MWSAGNTSKVGLFEMCCCKYKAAIAAAGAVFLASGSKIISALLTPICFNCSATKKRCSWLQITRGGAMLAMACIRNIVSCNRVWSLTNDNNCLGYALLESGHKD